MRRKRKKKSRWPFLVLGVLFFLGLGFVFNFIKAGGFESGEGVSILNPLNIFGNKKERVNILVFGVDGSDPEAVEKKRSDTIMLLSVDGTGKNPALLSIPRDTRVAIPGRKNLDKINHAHAYGGPELLVETVENLLDITVDYYVRINYRAVEEVVDALGGVEIDVPMNMKYNDPYDDPPLHINIPKGLQVLDGKNAVHFLRFRKGYANQDLGRIEAQQKFVEALKDKVFSPSIIVKIPQLIEIFYKNVKTNISESRMLTLGAKLAGLADEEITKLTLAGIPETINGVSYYIADETELAVVRNSYLVPESERVYPVAVLNGCGVKGIATHYKEVLESAGIKVSSVGNYSSMEEIASFIHYGKDAEKQAQKIAKELNITELILDEALSNIEIQVIIGSDLKI